MFAEVSIAELSFAELDAEVIVVEEAILLREIIPVMIIGDDFFRADMGANFDGVEIVVELERLGLTVAGINRDGSVRNNPGQVKLLREIFPIFRGPVGTIINIYVGGQETPDSPVHWTGPFPFTIGEDSSVQPLVESPYLAVKYTSQDQPVWSLLSMDLDIEPTGEIYDE